MRKPKAIVIMAIVAAALALGGVAVPLTSHPRFCASCHNIKPSYDSWVVSTHKDVTCVDCHVRPISVFGTPTDAHNLQATVHTEVCLSCHRAILRVSEVAVRDLPPPVQKVGLVMSHRKHIEAFAKRAKGEGCTTCHSRVVHEKPIKGYPIVLPRGHVSEDSEPYYPDHPEGTKLRSAALADCFRCHDGNATYEGKVLDKRCETCHLPEKIAGYLFN
ncbi:MAG: cytochrome C [Nitrospirae bacterium 13_2_20CM_62_7]|nr:MAG: cytochrome C [Nitrospirae bacterium 13_2_20CM_62_7]